MKNKGYLKTHLDETVEHYLSLDYEVCAEYDGVNWNVRIPIWGDIIFGSAHKLVNAYLIMRSTLEEYIRDYAKRCIDIPHPETYSPRMHNRVYIHHAPPKFIVSILLLDDKYIYAEARSLMGAVETLEEKIKNLPGVITQKELALKFKGC